MARTYRGEKQIVTIDVKDMIPFKMSALPSNWSKLKDIFDCDRSQFDDMIQKVLQDAVDLIPPRKSVKKINEDNFDDAFDMGVREITLKRCNTFYRGKHKDTKQLEFAISETAKWFHVFFKYWGKISSKERSIHLEPIKALLDERKRKRGTKKWDPLDLTLFCCEEVFGDTPRAGKFFLTPFREPASFRTTYLAKGPKYGRNLARLSPGEVMQLTKNTEHPLYKLTDICRNLQK